MFNPLAGTVTDKAPMNVGRGDLGATVSPKGTIFVAGAHIMRVANDKQLPMSFV